MLAVQPDAGASTNLANPETVPFTESFVSQLRRIFPSRSRTIVPQPAASLVRTNAELSFFCIVPDLNLRIGFQINPAIRESDSLVVDQEFIVREFFIGRQISTVTVVHEFFVFDSPVVFRVFGPFCDLLVSHIGRHFGQITRIEVRHSMPSCQIRTVKQRTKTFRNVGSRQGRSNNQQERAGK